MPARQQSGLRQYRKHWPAITTVLVVPALGAWASALAYFYELGRARFYGIPAPLLRVGIGEIINVAALLFVVAIYAYGMYVFQIRVKGMAGRLGIVSNVIIVATIALFADRSSESLSGLGIACWALLMAVVGMTASGPLTLHPMRLREWAFTIVVMLITGGASWYYEFEIGLFFAVGGVVIGLTQCARLWKPTEDWVGRAASALGKDYLNAACVVAVVILSMPFSYAIAHQQAGREETFLVASTHPSFVVVYISPDLYVLREYVAGEKPVALGSRMMILRVEDIAKTTLTYESLGPLRSRTASVIN